MSEKKFQEDLARLVRGREALEEDMRRIMKGEAAKGEEEEETKGEETRSDKVSPIPILHIRVCCEDDVTKQSNEFSNCCRKTT